MKKIITLVLTVVMMFSSVSAVFADDATELTLAEGSHLVLDPESKYVDRIDGTITVGELKANFAGNVDIAGKADDAAVATDDVIGDYKALIYGDVNRDGKINLADVSGILQNVAGWAIDMNTDAADVDKTGNLNLADITKVLKYIAGWDDISLGNVRMVFENKKVEAENEDATLQLSFTSIMNKVSTLDLESTDEYSYKIKLARNEYESCTVLLYSDTAKEGMTAELSDFVSEYGDAVLPSKLEWVYAIDYAVFKEIDAENFNSSYAHRDGNFNKGDMPEIVLEMADTFELKAETLQHFIITVDSDKDTPAGMYKATLTFKDAEGKEVKKADVYAYVWDFTLPDTPYSASLFSGNHKADNYEYMLEFNLSDYVLPYDITDPRADALMSDPRVTAFVIAGGSTGPNDEYGTEMYGGSMDCSIEETVANYNKVASNPEWFKKGLFYYFDEPWGPKLDNLIATYKYVTELLGTTNIRNMTPLAGNDGFGNEYCTNNGVDPVEYIKDYINVWCPQSVAFHRWDDGGNWGLRRFVQKFGEFADRAKVFKENGDEMWWYVCCSPEIPYANYFTWYQGVIVRLLSWQQYFNDVDGVLYYRTFGGTISKYKFDIGNGDGILQYDGKYWGREGYAASWRLLQVRDGFDDFDYLRMAEELVGRDAVMRVVEKVSDGMLRYTEDYRVLEACRDEIVDMILDNQAK
ncbi:MAG: DUF4091 domain-containing protein [Clostridia bacterium]|nr:DUF4091 domain-containing protein [Clostridia bacterium]